MSKRIAVVGAGPGGLSAAMLLSANGYDVTVYEKQAQVGGRNGSIQKDGYTFDIGPTFLMMLDVLEHLFSAAGRDLHKDLSVIPVDPLYRLVFGGGKRVLRPTRDRAKMKEALEAFAPGSFEGYVRYVEKESEKYDKLIPCLRVPYGKLSDFASWKFVTALPYLDAHLSLYDVLGRYFKDEDLKLAFTFQAKYIGMSPWKAPGTFSIISYIEHGGGIWHVQGGLNRISAAMAQAIEDKGGRIRLSTPVKELVVEDGTCRGLLLENGERVEADGVVLNADFSHAMKHLVPARHRRKYTDQKVERMRYSCSTFMVYLGLDTVYPDLEHHSIVFADDYRRNVEEIVGTKTLSSDFSVYIQNASRTDPTLAPPGGSTIYLLVPVPNNESGIDWDAIRKEFRDKVVAAAEARGGLKDLSRHIVTETVITPLDWERKMDVFKGATFNLSHDIAQMLYLRPHNEFEEFRNCWLVGGGTHPGSGLPTIYESGRISAELIMKRFG